MKFVDFFAGIGGFRRGMELAGHKCVGFCESDRFAYMSYVSMHLLTDEQRSRLAEMALKDRQKEIIKSEYRNGEWYADDIRRVYARNIPQAECWCFGFPCQDISIAGKLEGLRGNRSGLFYTVMHLIEQLREESRPEYLFIENVKNLLSVNGGWDFARLLVKLDEAGYDAEWQLLNSKDFDVPQNRERVFIIGRNRAKRTREVLPFGLDYSKADRGRLVANTLAGKLRDAVGIYPVDNIGILKVNRFQKLPDSTQDKQEIRIRQMNSKGYAELVKGGVFNMLYPNSKTRRGRVQDNGRTAPALQCAAGNELGVLEEIKPLRIRRLTPLEYFRLQGWTDEYFERAQFINSNSQLYKQAGNGVTVGVIYEIAKIMQGKEQGT